MNRKQALQILEENSAHPNVMEMARAIVKATAPPPLLYEVRVGDSITIPCRDEKTVIATAKRTGGTAYLKNTGNGTVWRWESGQWVLS